MNIKSFCFSGQMCYVCAFTLFIEILWRVTLKNEAFSLINFIREKASFFTCLLFLAQVSIDVVTGLLPWSGLPGMPVLDEFVKCLCSLLELLVAIVEKLPGNGR